MTHRCASTFLFGLCILVALCDGQVRAQEPAPAQEPVSVEEPVRAQDPVSVEEPARAQEPMRAEEPMRAAGAAVYDERHWTLGVPIWIPGYRGEFAIGDIQIGGESSGGSGFFERFFDSDLRINFFFMGSAAYRHGRWRAHGEVFGGKFTSDVKFKLTNGTIVSASIKPIVPRFVVEYRALEYNLGEPGRWTLQVWASTGVRYYDVELGAVVSDRSVNSENAWADPIVGFRVPAYLSEHWSFEFEADIGGFGAGSRLSWQVQSQASYRFNNLVSTGLGFSFLDVDYRGTAANSDFVFKSSVLGPRATILFDF